MKIVRQTYRPVEVAELLGMHLSTIYRRVEEGKIPAIRLGRILRVPIEQFHREYPEIPLPRRP